MSPDGKQTHYGSEELCEEALLPLYGKWVAGPKDELQAINTELGSDGDRFRMVGLGGCGPPGVPAIS